MTLEAPLNPQYTESLDKMANLLIPALSHPVTDEEIAVIEQPLFVTSIENLVAVRAGLDCAPDEEINALSLQERELLLGITAPALTHNRQRLAEVVNGWSSLPECIQPELARSKHVVTFATRISRDIEKFGNTESFALATDEQTIMLAGTVWILLSRLDNLQLDCLQNFKDDPMARLYKRVVKPTEDQNADIARIIDTPTEGVISIAQAISQIEADFAARGLPPPNEKALTRMTLSYTAAASYGYFGQMALRGIRFDRQFGPDNVMPSRYRAFLNIYKRSRYAVSHTIHSSRLMMERAVRLLGVPQHLHNPYSRNTLICILQRSARFKHATPKVALNRPHCAPSPKQLPT